MTGGSDRTMADWMQQGHDGNKTDDGQASDAVIIERILQGRANDFEIILNRYQRYVCALLSRRVEPAMVLELAHEVFVEAYRSLPNFNRQKPLTNWLAAITLHRCQDYWRRQYRNRETPFSTLSEAQQQLLEHVASGTAMEGCDPDAVARKEAQEILHLALAGLTPKDRMIVTLIHLEERSIKEVAAMLGWTAINVKVRAFRARRALKNRLTALLEGERRS